MKSYVAHEIQRLAEYEHGDAAFDAKSMAWLADACRIHANNVGVSVDRGMVVLEWHEFSWRCTLRIDVHTRRGEVVASHDVTGEHRESMVNLNDAEGWQAAHPYSTSEFQPEVREVIPKGELRDGAYYYGRCRNASVARWNAARSRFTYMRTKFEWRYPEDIRHPEDDDGFDLFLPYFETQPMQHEIIKGQ